MSFSTTTTSTSDAGVETNERLQPQPSKTVHAPLYLPHSPRPVRGWPSFWIVKKEAEEYLYPLYLRGWGVKFLPRKNYMSSHDRYVAYLTTEYKFANFSCATKFIADLAEIANDEHHHPSLISLQNSKRPTLTVLVQTDFALRPRWNEEDPDADPPLPRRVPGLTRRDLRFAVFLEEQYDKYQRNGRALEPRGTKIQSKYDTPTWEHLVSRFIRCSLFTRTPKDLVEREERREMLQTLDGPDEQGASTAGATAAAAVTEDSKETRKSTKEEAEPRVIKCVACEGPHSIRDCTVRAQHPPATLCYLCLEPHWWIDCPDRNREAFAQAASPLPDVGATSPSSPKPDAVEDALTEAGFFSEESRKS